MGLNVSTSMTFENREFLRNTAKNILTGKGASQESSSRVIQNTTIFNSKELYSNAQIEALKASFLIGLNGDLKETKKYLDKHKKSEEKKKYILGELWNSLENTEEKDSTKELYNLIIDYDSENIFAAA